eukprot:gene21194-23922_t
MPPPAGAVPRDPSAVIDVDAAPADAVGPLAAVRAQLAAAAADAADSSDDGCEA